MGRSAQLKTIRASGEADGGQQMDSGGWCGSISDAQNGMATRHISNALTGVRPTTMQGVRNIIRWCF